MESNIIFLSSDASSGNISPTPNPTPSVSPGPNTPSSPAPVPTAAPPPSPPAAITYLSSIRGYSAAPTSYYIKAKTSIKPVDLYDKSDKSKKYCFNTYLDARATDGCPGGTGDSGNPISAAVISDQYLNDINKNYNGLKDEYTKAYKKYKSRTPPTPGKSKDDCTNDQTDDSLYNSNLLGTFEQEKGNLFYIPYLGKYFIVDTICDWSGCMPNQLNIWLGPPIDGSGNKWTDGSADGSNNLYPNYSNKCNWDYSRLSSDDKKYLNLSTKWSNFPSEENYKSIYKSENFVKNLKNSATYNDNSQNGFILALRNANYLLNPTNIGTSNVGAGTMDPTPIITGSLLIDYGYDDIKQVDVADGSNTIGLFCKNYNDGSGNLDGPYRGNTKFTWGKTNICSRTNENSFVKGKEWSNTGTNTSLHSNILWGDLCDTSGDLCKGIQD